MPMVSMPRFLTALVMLLAALNVAPSFAHLLEAPPRLWVWTPELWREATVFHGQFALFAPVGAVVEIATILGAGAFAWSRREARRGLRPALIATFLFSVALAAWLAIVAPANAVLATWTPGAVPAEFDAVRLRWEAGHALIAVIKLVAFAMLAYAAAAAPNRTDHVLRSSTRSAASRD